MHVHVAEKQVALLHLLDEHLELVEQRRKRVVCQHDVHVQQHSGDRRAVGVRVVVAEVAEQCRVLGGLGRQRRPKAEPPGVFAFCVLLLWRQNACKTNNNHNNHNNNNQTSPT